MGTSNSTMKRHTVNIDLGGIGKKLLLEASNQVEVAKRINAIEENLMYQKYVAVELIAHKKISPEDHPAALDVIESAAKNLHAIRELRIALGIGSRFDELNNNPPLPDEMVTNAQKLLRRLEPEKEITKEAYCNEAKPEIQMQECEEEITNASCNTYVHSAPPKLQMHECEEEITQESCQTDVYSFPPELQIQECEEEITQASCNTDEDMYSAPPKIEFEESGIEVMDETCLVQSIPLIENELNQDPQEPQLKDDEEIKEEDEGFGGDLDEETDKQPEKIRQAELALVEEQLRESGIIRLEDIPEYDAQSELDSASISLAPSVSSSVMDGEGGISFEFFFGIKDFSKLMKKQRQNILSEIVHMPGRRPHLQAGVGFYPGKAMMAVLRHSKCECPGTPGSIEDTRKIRVTAFVVDQKKGENDYSIGSEVMLLRGGSFGWSTGLVAMAQCSEIEKRKLVSKNRVLLRYEIVEL